MARGGEGGQGVVELPEWPGVVGWLQVVRVARGGEGGQGVVKVAEGG